MFIKKIIWDFTDTDFEDCLYEEALSMVCLPNSIEVEELDEEANEYEIKEYLSECYGFEVKSYELDE